MKCDNPASVKQQMTHAARIDRLLSGRSGGPAERYLCEEHADIIDKEWITLQVGVEFNKTCQWEEQA